MLRILEPELMEEPEQVKAYAEADFSVPHNDFIQRIQAKLNQQLVSGQVLDLGCGPGDISCRFAEAFPGCEIDAVDGSAPMLEYGQLHLPKHLQQRIHFYHRFLPDDTLPKKAYQTLISNSLLHHLPNPEVLWATIKQYSQPGSRVFVMDLLRPASQNDAKKMVLDYTVNAAEILKNDFYHSLLAAFSIEEIKQQLQVAQLCFELEQVSDRHVFISGII